MSTSRLLTRIVNRSKPMRAQQIVDDEHRFDVGGDALVPIVSKSHCMNSR